MYEEPGDGERVVDRRLGCVQRAQRESRSILRSSPQVVRPRLRCGSGGVDVEEITKLIDKDTLSLNFIYASNISGAILDVETIITANLILSQNVEKRETVDSIILSASEHGGKIISNGKADDWGYSAIFKDLDDVTWELIAWNE